MDCSLQWVCSINSQKNSWTKISNPWDYCGSWKLTPENCWREHGQTTWKNISSDSRYWRKEAAWIKKDKRRNSKTDQPFEPRKGIFWKIETSFLGTNAKGYPWALGKWTRSCEKIYLGTWRTQIKLAKVQAWLYWTAKRWERGERGERREGQQILEVSRSLIEILQIQPLRSFPSQIAQQQLKTSVDDQQPPVW